MLRRLHDLACASERALDAFSASPWAQVALGAYSAAWVASEALRGKGIGWDGFLTIVAVSIAFAIRRRQAERDPRDETAPTDG